MGYWFYLFLVLICQPLLAAPQYRTLQCEDLIPPAAHQHAATPSSAQADHNGGAAPQATGAIVPELNEQTVRIPGYVVPVEGDEKSVKSFLLVPFFGACIHVPPPPSNQIVFVTLEQPATMDDLWDAVWVYGTLKTTATQHELAAAGYTMAGVQIKAYD